MNAITKTTATQRRTAKRLSKRERERLSALQAAEKEEARQEAISPAAQRRDVVAANGGVMRNARLVVDGISFKRANPIERMVLKGKGAEKATFLPVHAQAAARLIRAWDLGQSVGSVPSSLGASASPTTGYISPALLVKLNAQIDAKNEWEYAATWMGGAWKMVRRVVLEGTDLDVVAGELNLGGNVARGYLRAGLDRLIDFYRAVDKDGDDTSARDDDNA